MRRVLPRLVFCILAFARPASAQIAMPDGVALSPFPVLQSPAAYTTYGDGDGGVWAVFLGAQSGSALYAQHIRNDGSFYPGFDAAPRVYANSGTLAKFKSSRRFLAICWTERVPLNWDANCASATVSWRFCTRSNPSRV